RDRMIEDELGFTSTRTGEHGDYVAKGGTKGPRSDRGWRSLAMIYPNDVELIVLTNSYDDELVNRGRDLYDASWFTP
ncbi:MAG: hypothetical protein AAGA48_09250, partial [Myxococcota bacterium]